MYLIKNLYNKFRIDIECLLENKNNNLWSDQSRELIRLSDIFINDFYDLLNNDKDLKDNYIFNNNYQSIKILIDDYKSFINSYNKNDEEAIYNSISSFRILLLNNSLGFIDYIN